MSIASEISRLQQAKADIKTAIENKGVTVPSSATLDAYDGYIDDISSGGGGTPLEDMPVIYIDYDGTVLYGYTAEQFAQLTEHPANPDHSGDDIPLTSQGWNWTLSDAQTYVATNGYLVIGQMYITTDGATYIGIDTTKSASDKFTDGGFTISFQQKGANTVTVDWGDGSATETSSASNESVRRLSHTYATDGEYVIKFTPVNDDSLALNQGLFGDYATNDRLILYDAVLFVRYGKLRANTSIGKIARGNLETITIPNNILNPTSLFVQNSKLRAITIPSGTTTIGQDAFSFSYDLKYISIPKSTVTIGNSVFARCYNLEVMTLPTAMTTLGGTSFNYCHSIKTIIMPTTVTSLGSGIFSYCYKLEHIKVSSNITSCPGFSSCSSIKVLKLPTTLETIVGSSISNCYQLEECDIPDNVETIGSSAFRYCNSLKKVVIPDNVTVLNGSTFQDCYSLEELTLSENLTSISQYEFNNCNKLKELTLPNSLVSIGTNAFTGCFVLKDITIPNNVTTIGNSAFAFCTSVETITIGESVTSIGGTCFTAQKRQFDTLQAIYMLPQNPPSIASSSFSNLGDAFTIYVPQGRLSAYQSATNWTTLASKMVEMTT